METLGFERHDHAQCIETGLAAIEAHCASAGVQLTPVRRRVLEILMQRHRAMGAYEILDVLRAEGHGAQPPVAYRALEFLTTQGFVHRIERLNAFVACAHPGERHAPTFLICRACSAVAEADARPPVEEVKSAAARAGFAVERMAIEAEGLCPACQQGASA
ncbi:transcriptional repressor [Roseivivax sp. CAU 1753]